MKKNKNSVFWVNVLSPSSLYRILRLKISRQSVDIRFVKKTYLGWRIYLCLRFLRIINGQAAKVEYSMGDMRLPTGESLLYGSYRVSSETTVAVVDRLKESPVYQGLALLLPHNKINLYLEKCVYEEIFPILKFLCIIRWIISNEKTQCNDVIVWPENGFFSDLQRAWPDGEISLVANKPFIDFSRVRPFVKKLYGLGQDIFASVLPERLRPPSSKEPSIAIHYAEGIDIKRRSDIFWYPHSQIDPERVIVYFDRSYNHPITNEQIKQIESMGMRWVSLCWRRDIPCSLKSVWRPSLGKGPFLTAFKKMKVHSKRELGGTGKWLFKAGVYLIKEVEYWQAFYRRFNVVVHHDAIECGLQNIAQNIALDFVDGVRVGKQGSEFYIPFGAMIGYYPDHIFFSWNSRMPTYLQADRNRTDFCIVSGFPHNASFDKDRNDSHCLQKVLKDAGGQFLVTLYDNMFSIDLHYSKTMMISLYRNFLKWVIEDPEVGLIIKSKKPHVLDALPEIHDLLASAENTGRCIQLDNVYGRLPSDAAYGANIAVGIGISSAATEAVITAGCRGVHCELTGLHSHLYYQWGYGNVIFDDLDRLIMALKRYKENPENEPELGDWSSYIDKLDPFRDGRGGERIGTYMRWLLDRFDKGNNRDQAIQYANTLYVKQWGEDKVIDMTN